MNPFHKPNPQTPPNPQAQVPDHRVEQMVERMRVLELQNTQLRGQVDHLARAPQAPGAPPKEPMFKPEVQSALDQLVDQKLQAINNQHRQQIGWLADQLDASKFQQSYGGDKFAKYVPKVEQLRQEYQAQNKYITREDALRMVYFEETGKKGIVPEAPAPQAPVAPVFDTYTQRYVDPRTGQPAQQMGWQEEQVQEQPQEEQFQQTAPAQGWQPPPPATPPAQQNTGGMYPGARMQPGQGSPNGNAYGQNFGLPGQGMNSAAPSAHQAQAMRGPLSLEASDADLKAFETKFGDVPL